jgi:hypothetical protein
VRRDRGNGLGANPMSYGEASNVSG